MSKREVQFHERVRVKPDLFIEVLGKGNSQLGGNFETTPRIVASITGSEFLTLSSDKVTVYSPPPEYAPKGEPYNSLSSPSLTVYSRSELSPHIIEKEYDRVKRISKRVVGGTPTDLIERLFIVSQELERVEDVEITATDYTTASLEGIGLASGGLLLLLGALSLELPLIAAGACFCSAGLLGRWERKQIEKRKTKLHDILKEVGIENVRISRFERTRDGRRLILVI